jgi:antitoxin FitA
MSVSLSIKNVPDEVVQRLRERATRHRRSLQGELLDIVEQAADQPPALAVDDIYQRVKRLRLPRGGPRSVDVIRKTRDGR